MPGVRRLRLVVRGMRGRWVRGLRGAFATGRDGGAYGGGEDMPAAERERILAATGRQAEERVRGALPEKIAGLVAAVNRKLVGPWQR